MRAKFAFLKNVSEESFLPNRTFDFSKMSVRPSVRWCNEKRSKPCAIGSQPFGNGSCSHFERPIFQKVPTCSKNSDVKTFPDAGEKKSQRCLVGQKMTPPCRQFPRLRRPAKPPLNGSQVTKKGESPWVLASFGDGIPWQDPGGT